MSLVKSLFFTALFSMAILVSIECSSFAAPESCYFCHNVQFDMQDRNYCLHCHASNINVNTGTNGSFPLVYCPGEDLAGGNFYHVEVRGNRYGHNIDGVPGITRDTINAPGLNDRSVDFLSNRLTCAGKYGCHGDRRWVNPRDAMGNAHHDYSPAQARDGYTVATSYRFLLGVTGRELNENGAKWEFNPTPSRHNEYQGANTTLDPRTISFLCGECHGSDALGADAGNFHGRSGTGSRSSWLRHPSDIPLSGTECANYTEYDPLVPVARMNVNAVADPSRVSVYSGNESIMCLSCHRAHGSPYPSILRFEYNGYAASNAACRTCHTKH